MRPDTWPNGQQCPRGPSGFPSSSQGQRQFVSTSIPGPWKRGLSASSTSTRHVLRAEKRPRHQLPVTSVQKQPSAQESSLPATNREPRSTGQATGQGAPPPRSLPDMEWWDPLGQLQRHTDKVSIALYPTVVDKTQ